MTHTQQIQNVYGNCQNLTDSSGELWKTIVGYEGLYEISNFGRVKSLPKPYFTEKQSQGNTPTKILKQEINYKIESKAYCRLKLHKNLKFKWFNVHRLVAQAFIPNPENKPEVNHKNGIKTDNRVKNLEWNTSSENKKHAIRRGLVTNLEQRLGKRVGVTHRMAVLSEKDVYKIRKRYDAGEGPAKIWKDYPTIGQSGIISVCRRKTWKHLKEKP